MNLRNLWRRWTGSYPPDDESEGVVSYNLKPTNRPKPCIGARDVRYIGRSWTRHLYKGTGSCVRCGIADPRQKEGEA